MVSYKTCCELACNYFEKIGQNNRLAKSLEVEEAWIFFANNDELTEIGGYGIIVYKVDGRIEDFMLPNPQNLILLGKAIPVAVPCEFP